MCRVLGVSRSGYYDWVHRARRPPVGRHAENRALVEEIRTIHARFGYYGAPRIHQELLRRSHRVGRRRVARLMRLNDIKACRGKRKSRPRSAPPARRPEIVDRVQRDFGANVADALWFTDITQIRTDEGWLYAAVVLDAFNREVISWAVAGHDTPQTAITALTEAIAIRHPPPGCLIHSDRGYQFTSADWLTLAAAHHLKVSLGERKSCFDNAAMESWFASYKNEALYPNGQPRSRADARKRLFQYIWDYNSHRLHSRLGYVAPKTYAATSSTCP
jgi:putative transposase